MSRRAVLTSMAAKLGSLARWLWPWRIWPPPWSALDLVDLPVLFSSDEVRRRWWETRSIALGERIGAEDGGEVA